MRMLSFPSSYSHDFEILCYSLLSLCSCCHVLTWKLVKPALIILVSYPSHVKILVTLLQERSWQSPFLSSNSCQKSIVHMNWRDKFVNQEVSTLTQYRSVNARNAYLIKNEDRILSRRTLKFLPISLYTTIHERFLHFCDSLCFSIFQGEWRRFQWTSDESSWSWG